MSRIYEALQRAEAERSQEPRPSFEAVENPPSPSAGYDRSVGYAQAEFAATLAEQQPSAAPAQASIGALTFESITRHAWKPSIEKLPALLDRGPAVEQFRSLRSRLNELRDVRPLKTVLISSGLPQEGKSFVSANLAISLARHRNNRVLLIDGDMRRYTVHEMLGASSRPGLADYIAGEATVAEVLQRADLGDAPPEDSGKAILANLAFLPGGNGGDRAADLSGNARFGDLLKAVAPLFDWIVIDSSPVIPVSDATNLARSCDGVLLVARGGVTKYPVAQRAAAELRASNVLGFVLNAVREAPQVGNYYGYSARQE